ncbi:MAG: dihydrodipicolinate reductase [Nanoarchaeota archaeon]|nr:dihydrodipicolinate reductase [Nanoarchaeota archaeon]
MQPINIMVNGLPGKMARAVASAIKETQLHLIPFSLTGPSSHNVHPSIQLIKPAQRESKIRNITDIVRSLICVDYTTPDSVNGNADFYCRHNLPFVMGTTGGDRAALVARVQDSEISAVIAPNMAKQIVLFQAMMTYAAHTFPTAFRGYTLEITESHQQGKKDTSGTARAMVGYFNQLGIPFEERQIKMIRDPAQQVALGVPDEALSGHGWHTYTLRSENESVLFQFTHNVNGREIYAQGTLDAVRFLAKKMEQGEKGKVYSMIDVLKG